MLRSTSRPRGLNCQTEPYSFSARKHVEHSACTKSCQATSPGCDEAEGLKNIVEKAFHARLSTENLGCGSERELVSETDSVGANKAGADGVPRVLVLGFANCR